MNSPFQQDRIAAARIMVVGCGALGNEVLKNLALMGAENLVVIDFDRVEQGNLCRSVLFEKADADASRYKVDAVAERLRKMNPRMSVQTIRGDVSFDVGLGLVRSMDAVIGCVDNRLARYCINRLCMRAGKPWIDGGIDALEGTVRVFIPGKNCYACSLGPEGLKDMARRLPCSGVIRRNEEAGKAPTTPLAASVIGSVQVQEALKLIHPELLDEGGMTSLCGKMFYFEGGHLSTRTVEFRAWDDDCPVHEPWEPVTRSSISLEMPVETALGVLREELDCKDATIHLTGDCFVDFVYRKDDNRHRSAMMPGRAVAAWVERDSELGSIPFSGLYQHEYREIDSSFPYKFLTLGQLGIPARDVLYVSSESADHYVEMN